MSRIRWIHLALGLAATAVATAGCGAERSSTTTVRAGLDVFLASAKIQGADGLGVQPLPAGTLRDGDPLSSHVLLDAGSEVSIAGLARFEGTAQRAGGEGELGVTGVCGQGWTADGERIDTDPCSAAEYVTDISAGQSHLLEVRLYPATDSGSATAGTYKLTIPLDESGDVRLDLTYRLAEAGQLKLPPWPKETAPLMLTFEPSSNTRWWELRIRIEDGYGRVIDERDLARYKDSRPNLQKDGVFAVDVPRGLPLRTVLLNRDGDSWVPCNRSGAFVGEERGWVTLLTDACLRR